MSPLKASQEWLIKILQLWIWYDADLEKVKNNEYPPLLVPVSNKRVEIVEIIMKSIANVNIVSDQGENLFDSACEFNCIEIVKILLEYGADM